MDRLGCCVQEEPSKRVQILVDVSKGVNEANKLLEDGYEVGNFLAPNIIMLYKYVKTKEVKPSKKKRRD